MRPLTVVDVTDPLALVEPLRRALFEEGPAIMPRSSGGQRSSSVPSQVADSVAVVIETSGSTGHPKRVGLSAKALLASAKASEEALGGPGQWILAVPTHYVAGVMVLVRSLVGSTMPVAVRTPFSPSALADVAVSTAHSTRLFTSLVPAQLARVLEEASEDRALDQLMRSCDRILVGGQAIPPGLMEKAAAAGYVVTRTYGSTETAGGCVWDGRPIGDTQIALMDGQVALSGSMLAEGYVDDEARTAQSFVLDGGTRWYRSDDRGHIGEDGTLSITGRVDDVVVSGGVKVSLGEIEAFLRELVHDREICVVSVPHETWGEVPVVVSTSPLSLEEIRAGIKQALGPASQPNRVLVVESMPRLPSGKLDRVAVTNWAREQR